MDIHLLSNDTLRIVAESVERTFDVDVPIPTQPSELYRPLREALVQRIIELLTKNPERLMAILYRIDVSESIVHEIFSTALPPDVPDLLADAILERQVQKVVSRGNH